MGKLERISFIPELRKKAASARVEKIHWPPNPPVTIIADARLHFSPKRQGIVGLDVESWLPFSGRHHAVLVRSTLDTALQPGPWTVVWKSKYLLREVLSALAVR